ncbi:MAG: dUTP diphosphatase [Desulfuromonadales bacterium]|nr:dUTP diphosphatase [Desulfuromonadales bacterium]MDW7756271.1 dUTP diphosphatase [Desulfuromonadales bacterium]
MKPITVRIKKLRDDAIVPRYMTDLAAGMDLFAALDSPVRLARGQRLLVPTGIALAIPAGFEGQVRPRSGLALKKGISLVNSPGTIDADYRGELGIILINHGQDEVTLSPGDRIAQLVIAPVRQAVMQVVEDLEATERNTGGFGHTGTSLEV